MGTIPSLPSRPTVPSKPPPLSTTKPTPRLIPSGCKPRTNTTPRWRATWMVMLTDQLNEGPPIQVDGNSTEVKTTGTINGTNWVKRKRSFCPNKPWLMKLEMKLRTTRPNQLGLRSAKSSFFTRMVHLESTIQTHTLRIIT